ncbi:hypothetical protein RB195_005817 [Necator americanus]|uniref:Reverse transcriptase domain-containing protein n=1 Tax=Necator americanus TaxID=51031 RepID=A0ABR1BPR4_NECAM
MRDEQTGFRPGRSTIDQVFFVKSVIEIWQRYSKQMQLAFLDFEAAFDSPHRGRLLNGLRADGVPGKFVHLLDDMNQRITAAVRAPAGYTTPLISSRPRTGIRVDGQPIELVDEFCYLGCTLKNNGSYERDVQQRCAKAISAFKSSTKCLWSTLITNEVKLRIYISAIRPIMMYGSETRAAPFTLMERLDCTGRKLIRPLLSYFWPSVCHHEDLHVEIDVVYRRMTCGRYQHFALPSKVVFASLVRYIKKTGRSPCPPSSEEFVGFELEEATWPRAEVLD